MRSLRSIPVFLLLILGVGAGPRHEQGLHMADARLSRGQWRLAAQAYRELLLNRPKSPRARVGLAQALAELSQCEEALELLDSVRGKWAWTAEAANAEGRCRLLLGDPWRAIESYEESTELAPYHPLGWLALAQTRASVGDSDRVEEALDGLRLCEGGPELELLVRVEMALRTGDQSVEGWLAQAKAVLGGSSAVAIYDARAWMDQEDPFEAERVLWAQLSRSHHPQVAFWRAEALRRQGSTSEAWAVFGRRSYRFSKEDALGISIRVRVLVDLGELKMAEALVQDLSDPLGPEGLATRWYLARATGRADELAALNSLWTVVDEAAGRRLEQLVPVGPPDHAGIPERLGAEPEADE